MTWRTWLDSLQIVNDLILDDLIVSGLSKYNFYNFFLMCFLYKVNITVSKFHYTNRYTNYSHVNHKYTLLNMNEEWYQLDMNIYGWWGISRENKFCINLSTLMILVLQCAEEVINSILQVFAVKYFFRLGRFFLFQKRYYWLLSEV